MGGNEVDEWVCEWGGWEGSVSHVLGDILRRYQRTFSRHTPFSPDEVGLSASALPLPDSPNRRLSEEEGVT